jgi:hypothetical protein
MRIALVKNAHIGERIMSNYFDSMSDFYDWCEENNFDSDTEYDRDVETYERDMNVWFYIKHNEKDVYREVFLIASYDHGYGDIEVEDEDLTRIVTQVMTEKVEYLK